MSANEFDGKHEPANAVEGNNAHLSTPGHSGPIPKSDSQADSSVDHLPQREIEFAELQDGSLAEMIEDPTNPAKSLLAVYANGTVRYTDNLLTGSEVLVPLSRTDPVSRHVSLPQGAEAYLGLRPLMGGVGLFLAHCLDADLNSLLLMIAHVFCTWFPEKLPFAPYLAFVGPPGSGKTTALRILSMLCRRGLATSDITSAAFYDVCHRMHPTILIDETATAGHQGKLAHLLRSSSTRGFVALRKDKAQLAYGPKVLSWVELPNDAALNSRCIIIPMHKTKRVGLKGPDDPEILQLASRLRRCLLQFRFEHYRTLSPAKIPAGHQLSSRTLDLYRALSLALAADEEACAGLADLIADQRRFQSPLLTPPQASAVRVLYASIHDNPTTGGFRLNGLKTAISLDLASHGEPSALGERKVGDILTSLSLTNRGRVNPGNYVLWLDRTDRERIHRLAVDYEVDGISPEPVENCEICVKKDPGVPDCSDEPKHERHERHERGLEGGNSV
jgi:hypothetical protein